MSDKTQAASAIPAADAPQSTAAPRGIARRTLLRGGAAAAPVLLTLHSGPVAASGSMSCTVASSFVSVATFASRNPGVRSLQCSTMNAHHWHQQAKLVATLDRGKQPKWATRKLSEYLGRSSSRFAELDPQQPSDYRIWQVMGLGAAPATSGELGVLHHVLGLALSIDYGGGAVNTGGVFNRVYLSGVWQNYKNNGHYRHPAGHVSWNETELISWLKLLQYPLPLPQL